ncbi:MAG TPA: hypothetical protein DCK98_14585 [Chloroflexi bacterium]|nr:hypothetical protein [Chloroflexota bacterium]HAL28704.1 hypothetical protein [Chloroflexota bacterium]
MTGWSGDQMLPGYGGPGASVANRASSIARSALGFEVATLADGDALGGSATHDASRTAMATRVRILSILIRSYCA